jgi:transcriptional regulator with XRE-family HTH domain
MIQSVSQPNRRYPVGMTEYSVERNIGARIAAARRSRGFRTTKELAAKMPGTGISAAVLENIESGRRSNLDVSQLLNIAHTLGVPVTALLAPLHRPGDPIDLPNLTEELATMTAGEFDAWVAGITTASYTARTGSERDDLAQLNALRELQTTRRELDRLHVVAKLSEDLPEALRQLDADQINATQTRINKLRHYLNSSGWEV